MAPTQRGVEVEQRDDEFTAIPHHGALDDSHLKSHVVVAEQPPLAPQPGDERGQVAILDRAHDLLHDKHLPRPAGLACDEGERWSVDEVPNEATATDACVHVPSEVGIEHDGSVQQDGRDGLVLEAARAHERIVDGGEIVPGLTERSANRVEIAERRGVFEGVRKEALSPKQLQQPLVREDDAVEHRWRHDRAGVDQQLPHTPRA